MKYKSETGFRCQFEVGPVGMAATRFSEWA
jgi:hypothetical protein